MLISIDWIKEFVDLDKDLSEKEISERFTMGTAEVEGYEITGECFSKIKVAKITAIEKHPEADKLNLVTFEYGAKETKQVVCGASNVRIGMKIPYAPLGVSLPCGLTLEPKKIRGVLSEGMLCSEEELGFSDKSLGILEYPEETTVGLSLLEFYGQKRDLILDVDNKSLTHRPDLWGHYGNAREFSALYEKELKNPFNADWSTNLKNNFDNRKSPLKVKLEGESAGLSYFGLSLENIQVGDSPEWMKTRLLAVGLRPINSIVDISNYVMLELGIPLHIFDRDKISGDTVIIKRLKEEESFTTLDEIERKLIPGDTVICDNEKTLVVAGIMGGLVSGVTTETKNIFIEVANWKAAQVRLTSTRLGLRTDSSSRYEKSLDCHLLERTLLRTLDLVLQLSPRSKVVGTLEYDGRDLSDKNILKIKTSSENICKTLGHDIAASKIDSIFNFLGFEIEKKSDDLIVSVPTYRATKDIHVEADLIEEVGRIIGYDNISPSSPMLEILPVRRTPARELAKNIRDFMVYKGSSLELMTYPLVGEKLYKKASWEVPEKLKLINSLSKDQCMMRNSLVPSLLEVAATNHKNYNEFRGFELGRTYHPDSKSFSTEKSMLGIVFYNKERSPYLEMANTVEKLLGAVNIPGQITDLNPKFKNPLIDDEWLGTHPYEYQNIRIMGKLHGVMTSVHPILLKEFKIKGNMTIALIDLSSFENKTLKDKMSYKPLPKFPGSNFDWTVVVSTETKVQSVLDSLKKVKIKELHELSIRDVFPLNTDEKAVTIRAKFLDPASTLSGEFITESSKSLVNSTEASGFPLKS